MTPGRRGPMGCHDPVPEGHLPRGVSLGPRGVPLPRLALLLLALSLGTTTAPPAARAGPVLADRDGNGLPDYARVGDWDDDGTLELADVQAAIDALTDPGAKHVYVTPGVYVAPLSPPPGVGLVRLPSRTLLQCAGSSQTQLRGVPPTNTGFDRPVVTNADHDAGNSQIAIQDCQVHGGMTSSYSQTLGSGPRMGIFLNAVVGGSVTGSFVRHTHHACLYAKNSKQLLLADNRLEDCGNYPRIAPYVKPGIYLYADNTSGDGITENVQILNNVIRRAGGAAVSTRRQSYLRRVRSIRVEGTYAEDTAQGCLQIRGVEGFTARDTTCVDTGPGITTRDITAYYSGGGPASEYAIRDVTVDGLTVERPQSAGVELFAFIESMTVRNLTVQESGGSAPCLRLRTPVRGLTLEDVTLRTCGGHGVQVIQKLAALPANDGELALRRLDVDGTDVGGRGGGPVFDGVRLDGPQHRLTLDGVGVRDFTGHGVHFSGAAEDVVVQALEIEGTVTGRTATPRHGVLLSGPVAQSWILDLSVGRLPGGDALAVAGAATGLMVDGVLAFDDAPAGEPRQRGAVRVDVAGSTGALANPSCLGTQPGEFCVLGALLPRRSCGLGFECVPFLAAAAWSGRRRRTQRAKAVERRALA